MNYLFFPVSFLFDLIVWSLLANEIGGSAGTSGRIWEKVKGHWVSSSLTSIFIVSLLSFNSQMMPQNNSASTAITQFIAWLLVDWIIRVCYYPTSYANFLFRAQNGIYRVGQLSWTMEIIPINETPWKWLESVFKHLRSENGFHSI